MVQPCEVVGKEACVHRRLTNGGTSTDARHRAERSPSSTVDPRSYKTHVIEQATGGTGAELCEYELSAVDNTSLLDRLKVPRMTKVDDSMRGWQCTPRSVNACLPQATGWLGRKIDDDLTTSLHNTRAVKLLSRSFGFWSS